MGLRLLNPAEFRELVSGRRRGLRAAAWRAALRVAELPYAAAVAWRNRRFDRRPLSIRHAPVPVVSVGNLSVGGTGKSPMVEWLARWFRTRGVRVAVVSRGYKAEQGALNDEALELEQKLPDVPHLQDPDRWQAAQTAVEEFETQLVILDDGFQHRRLHRDLDLVLLDALEPFGFDHLLPRGTLREPVRQLRRAQVVALSRADTVDSQQRQRIRTRVQRVAPQADWLELEHRPLQYLAADGRSQPLSELQQRRLAAFCGIGNPAGFAHTLKQVGGCVEPLRVFPDHHAYSRDDVESLDQWIRQQNVDAAVCTHKDLVKLQVRQLGGRPLWALQIGMHITHGEEELALKLQRLLDAALNRS